MYAQRNIEARSCNHCCCGKAISITYAEYVFVARGIQHAMRHIVICGLSGSTTFFNIISKMVRFSKKKVIEHKTRVFSLRLLSETFFILRRNGRDMTKTLYWPSYKVAF